MAKRRATALLKFVMTADGKIVRSKDSLDQFSGIDGVGECDDISHFKSLLEADAVDEFQLTILPMIMGSVRMPSLTGLPEGFLPKKRRFRLKSLTQSDGMAILHYFHDRRKTAVTKK